jgi:Ala-tRNA(Pro) deacylase
MNQVVFEKIVNLLDNDKVDYQLFEHKPVYTSEEAARIRGTSLGQGAKALVVFADKKPMMIVVPGDRRIDFKKFKAAYQVKDLRMATPEEVEELTGAKVGAVPPLGIIHHLPTYVDQSLGKNEEIAFNAGLHTKSIKMKYQDWFRLVKPKLGDFSKE